MKENEKIARVLNDSAQLLRKTASERDVALARAEEAEAKVASYERHVRAEKVAMQMHNKGIHTDTDFATLVASLEKSASEGKLDVIEQAVAMTATDMSLKTASIHEAPAGGASDFERFLYGGIG